LITQEIDVVKLYSGTLKNFEDAKAWNRWLKKCVSNNNINELVSVRKGLQIGIASAEKKKLVNEDIAATFCRWINSIDKTIRQIARSNSNKLDYKNKKELDNNIEKYLREQSY